MFSPPTPETTVRLQAVTIDNLTAAIAKLRDEIGECRVDRDQAECDARTNHDRCVTLTDQLSENDIVIQGQADVIRSLRADLDGTIAFKDRAISDASTAQANQRVKFLNFVNGVRNLIIDDGADAFPDGFVDKLVKLGMDPLTRDVDVTFEVTITVRGTIGNVPHDTDDDDLIRQIESIDLDDYLGGADTDDLERQLNRRLAIPDVEADGFTIDDVSWSVTA